MKNELSVFQEITRRRVEELFNQNSFEVPQFESKGRKETYLFAYIPDIDIHIYIYVDGAEFSRTNVDHRFESPDFINIDELWKSFTQALEEYLFH